MYKHILAAIDGSETSNAGLRHAIQLAKEHRAQLRLVHVVDEVDFNFESSDEVMQFRDGLMKSGDILLQKGRKVAIKANLEVQTKLLEIQTLGERVADVIVAEAKSWPADLVIVGTHGRRGLSRVFLGSVAEGIARTAPTPVLLIRGLAKMPRRPRTRSR
jgi:nucleotide-binding universal stress UspA family protein